MFATPSVPRASASVASLVMLAGLALIYWSLTGLGVLVANSESGEASRQLPSGNTVTDTDTGRIVSGNW